MSSSAPPLLPPASKRPTGLGSSCSRVVRRVAIFGPVASTWFGLLQRHVVHQNKHVQTLLRVFVDQSAFAPVMIGVFCSSMAALEGASPRERLNQSYVPAMTANYYMWPLVQVINFTFVPPALRLLFVNVLAVGWNTYLSFLNSKSEA